MLVYVMHYTKHIDENLNRQKKKTFRLETLLLCWYGLIYSDEKIKHRNKEESFEKWKINSKREVGKHLGTNNIQRIITRFNLHVKKYAQQYDIIMCTLQRTRKSTI